MNEAGFAEIEITPPAGTAKIGMLRHLTIERVADPLYARAAVFTGNGPSIGFIGLDTLCIRWSTTQAIRQRIADELDFPGDHVMVAATHNHAGPAVAHVGDVERDETYLAHLVDRCVEVFAAALATREPAILGFGHKAVFGFSFNRRVVLRDGLVRTQGRFSDPDALYVEGPIDPEMAVLAARGRSGRLLGALINFTCHPVFHGGDDVATASWPGVLATSLKAQGCPVPLVLNGAAGDIHHVDPTEQIKLSMQEMGDGLATHAHAVLDHINFTAEAWPLTTGVRTLQLPYREPTEEQVRGMVRGAQRFVDPAIYDRHMPALLQRIAERQVQPAEVQMLGIGNVAFVSIPAELFCRLGLEIKQQCHARHALIVGFANGMVGYVPTTEAFERGGYETTFIASSRLAPEAGDMLVDAAVDLASHPEPGRSSSTPATECRRR